MHQHAGYTEDYNGSALRDGPDFRNQVSAILETQRTGERPYLTALFYH